VRLIINGKTSLEIGLLSRKRVKQLASEGVKLDFEGGFLI